MKNQLKNDIIDQLKNPKEEEPMQDLNIILGQQIYLEWVIVF